MPWRETCVQEQRVRFIHDWQKREDSMAELCRRHGVVSQNSTVVLLACRQQFAVAEQWASTWVRGTAAC